MTRWTPVSQIQKEPIHLGDEKKTDWPRPQGRSWETSFNIGLMPAHGLYLDAEVWHTEAEHNEVVINETRIGHLTCHRGKRYKRFHLEIPEGVLHEGRNELRIKAAELGDHGLRLDDFLIRHIFISRKAASAPTTDKALFFRAFGKAMQGRGWKKLNVRGFAWACRKDEGYSKFVYGVFDADHTDMLEGAHLKLARWADENETYQSRMALAVFNQTSKKDIEYITKELQKGTRMGKQSMTGVIHLRGNKFYKPQEVGWAGYKRIFIHQDLCNEIQAVLDDIAAPK